MCLLSWTTRLCLSNTQKLRRHTVLLHRFVLSHYHRCKDPKCAVCAPVREVIQKSHQRSIAQQQVSAALKQYNSGCHMLTHVCLDGASAQLLLRGWHAVIQIAVAYCRTCHLTHLLCTVDCHRSNINIASVLSTFTAQQQHLHNTLQQPGALALQTSGSQPLVLTGTSRARITLKCFASRLASALHAATCVLRAMVRYPYSSATAHLPKEKRT